jgi:prepilin peptidase CpaA
MTPVAITRSILVAGVVVLLAAICVSDVRYRRVPNALVASLAILGLLASTLRQPWVAGLSHGVLGLLAGLALWMPFWLFHMIGAGDVKLFAAAAAWLGPSLVPEAALLAALYGGLAALGMLIVQRGAWLTFVRLGHALYAPGILRDTPGTRGARLPYGVAITAGVLTAARFPGILL